MLGNSGRAPIDKMPDRWSFDPEAGPQTRDLERPQPTLTMESGGVDAEESYRPVPQLEESQLTDIEAQSAGRPNLSVLFTVAFLAFFALAPRFLEGNAFMAVLVILIAVRWLYGRRSRTPAANAGPNT